MIKVIERLRTECVLNAEEDSGFSRDILWLCNEAEDMSAELDKLERRIEQLEDRRNIQDELLTDKCDELKAATLRIAQLEKVLELLEEATRGADELSFKSLINEMVRETLRAEDRE